MVGCVPSENLSSSGEVLANKKYEFNEQTRAFERQRVGGGWGGEEE